MKPCTEEVTTKRPEIWLGSSHDLGCFNPFKDFHCLSMTWKYWSFLHQPPGKVLKVISKIPSIEGYHSKNKVVYI